MAFVSIKMRGVRHLSQWSVGHAWQAWWWVSDVRELNTVLPPPSPVVSGGHPLLPPSPGTDPGRSWGSGG